DERSLRIVGQHLHSGADTEKFGNGHTRISDQQSQHREGGPAHTKLLAYKICQAFTGDSPHSRAHFLNNSKAKARNSKRPEKTILISCPCLRKCSDTTSIIARIGGDQSRP